MELYNDRLNYSSTNMSKRVMKMLELESTVF